MMPLPRIPTAEQPISADWGRDVVAALRALQLIAGCGVFVSRGPNGTHISTGKIRSMSGTSSVNQAWDISIESSTATCTRCIYMRGGVTMVLDDLDITLTGDSGATGYIAAKINTETGAGELIFSAVLNSVIDDSMNESDQYVRVLLYAVAKSGNNWAITADYRNLPKLPVYS